MKHLYYFLCFILCVVVALADQKKEGAKSIHEAKKQLHRSHKEEHRNKLNKFNKHEAEGIRKHAPELVSLHDAHLQMDLGYNKKRGHEIAHDEFHLQELQIEDARHEKKMQHKIPRRKLDGTKDHFIVPVVSSQHGSNKLNRKRNKDDKKQEKYVRKGHKGMKKPINPKKKMQFHKKAAIKD